MKNYHWTNTGIKTDSPIEFFAAYTAEDFAEEFDTSHEEIGEKINMDCAGAPLNRIFEREGTLYLCGENDESEIEVWEASGPVMDLDGYIHEADDQAELVEAEVASLIEDLVGSAILGDLESDSSCGGKWRSGEVTTPDGDSVSMGGGWIETAESANQANEEAGIAGGLRQGVFYPNETIAGQFRPYSMGEDESGWQKEIMPIVLGENWEDHDDARDIAERIYSAVQEELARLAGEN